MDGQSRCGVGQRRYPRTPRRQGRRTDDRRLQDGGTNVGSSSAAIGRQQEALATIFNIGSMLANRLAEYMRRQDDWDHQANLATIELKQIDQQLAAAQIRLAIAQQCRPSALVGQNELIA